MSVAGTGASAHADPLVAAREAALGATTHLRLMSGNPDPQAGCDLALVFCARGAARRPVEVMTTVARISGARAIAGCSADAVLSEQGELVGHGVAVLLLAEIQAVPALVPDLGVDPAGAARSLARSLSRAGAGSFGAPGALLLLADTPMFSGPVFLRALQAELPPGTPVFGGGAATGDIGAWVCAGQPDGVHLRDDAVAAVWLSGTRPTWGVSQACRPLTPPLSITHGSGDGLFELAGRRASDVLSEVIEPAQLADAAWLRAHLLVGQPRMGPGQRPALRPFRVHGIDPQWGVIQLEEEVPLGTQVVLACRDPAYAKADLAEMIQDVASRLPGPPGFGLYTDGLGRGGDLYQDAPSDMSELAARFPGVPMVGWRAAGELAPLEGQPTLNRYAGVLALFDQP